MDDYLDLDTLMMGEPPEAEFEGLALECVKCRTVQPADSLTTGWRSGVDSAAPGCIFCGGELRPTLPPIKSLGVDLSNFVEASGALPVHRVLSRYAECCNVKFSLGENPIDTSRVFQPEAVLPVIAIEAMRIWQSLERRPGEASPSKNTLGVRLVRRSDSFFRLSAEVQDIGSDTLSTLRLLVFTLASRRVLGLAEGERIDISPRLAMWETINWESHGLAEIPMPPDFDPKVFQREFIRSEEQRLSMSRAQGRVNSASSADRSGAR